MAFNEGSVAHFYKVRDEFNKGNKTAANMLYLLARCVKGSVRYSSTGMFNQSPDKRRKGTSPLTLAKNIYQISAMLKGKVKFASMDYRKVLEQAVPGDLVYMDPPYQGVCNSRDNRYFSGIDFTEFVEAITDLNARGVDFAISYDGLCGDKQYGEDLPEALGWTMTRGACAMMWRALQEASTGKGGKDAVIFLVEDVLFRETGYLCCP